MPSTKPLPGSRKQTQASDPRRRETQSGRLSSSSSRESTPPAESTSGSPRIRSESPGQKTVSASSTGKNLSSGPRSSTAAPGPDELTRELRRASLTGQSEQSSRYKSQEAPKKPDDIDIRDSQKKDKDKILNLHRVFWSQSSTDLFKRDELDPTFKGLLNRKDIVKVLGRVSISAFLHEDFAGFVCANWNNELPHQCLRQ